MTPLPHLLAFLLLFPLAAAVLVFVFRNAVIQSWIIYAAAAVLVAASCFLLGGPLDGRMVLIGAHVPGLDSLIFIAELVISAGLFLMAFQRRDIWVGSLLVIQTSVLVWFHQYAGHHTTAAHNLFADTFSIMMGLIVGVIGTLIAVYAVGYMKDFHHHHPEVRDDRPAFFGLIFIFLSAMFGVVFSNNLTWLLFFWEITTVCSFLLIRYKCDEVSVRNAFWALRWNLLGGIGFLFGIIYLQHTAHTIELNGLLALPKLAVVVPVALLCFAGMTKSAQLPFSSWLTGAMVAPTPVSALLHSSTMVKAGVYLVLRFAGSLEGTLLGMIVALIGAVTFLIGSFICISQNDAKKVLAWSTIANLGLIILCAGIGTYEALWAGMLLIIFHAVAKGLLFMCVGAVEHQIHSRQIEDMEGLIARMPKMSVMIQIGIAGMFLAPFGMLISKWAVLRAIVDTSPILALVLVYGSSATLLFWVKWLGKLLVVEKEYKNVEGNISADQWLPLGVMAAGTVLVCGFFGPVARVLVEPHVLAVFGRSMSLGQGNLLIMSAMLLMVGLFPLMFLDRGRDTRRAAPYLAGANTGGDRDMRFRNSLGHSQAAHVKNYYLDSWFGEDRLHRIGVMVSIIILAAMALVGGV